MSISKPTKVPEWASDGGALVTEPSSGKKQSGWTAPGSTGEKPRLDYFNWWQKYVYLWAKWLNDQLDSSGRWTELQKFLAGIEASNSATAGVAAKLTGRADRAPLQLVPQTQPSTATNGDVTIDSTDKTIQAQLNSNWETVISQIGASRQADNGIRPNVALVNAYGGSAPVFGGGWVSNVDTPASSGHTVNAVGFWKDAFGVVHLQGIAGRSDTNPGGGSPHPVAVAFTLPAGFRPSNRVALRTALEDVTYGSAAVVYIDPDGSVIPVDNITKGTNYGILLDGLTFLAA